jgi:PAS domain-containing protein
LPDRANSWFDGFEFLPEENLAKGIETACQAKNGRTISAIISGSVIRNETGKVQETILLLQDVTVRNRMIEALAESEERLRSTLASISDLIFVLNRENVFVEYYSTDAADGKFPPFYAVIGRSIADIFSESVVRQMEMAIASNGISKARSLAELMKTLTGGTGSP